MRNTDGVTASNILTEGLETHLGRLPPAWRTPLMAASLAPVRRKLAEFLAQRLAQGARIYPHAPLRALEFAPPDAIRAIILGQDPYHGPNQAQGLAFSVPDTCRCPPSLRNIRQELAANFPDQVSHLRHDLGAWAQQGVLLLNAVLTVEDGQPASHSGHGWEALTDAILETAVASPRPRVALLWGAHAQRKRPLLEAAAGGPLLILQANHPSPLSARRPPRPFMGCGHFRQANAWLQARGEAPLDWLAAT
ncbi:MAG: uracil-DNA glycosylase [Castellaniella sp.]